MGRTLLAKEDDETNSELDWLDVSLETGLFELNKDVDSLETIWLDDEEGMISLVFEIELLVVEVDERELSSIEEEAMKELDWVWLLKSDEALLAIELSLELVVVSEEVTIELDEIKLDDEVGE